MAGGEAGLPALAAATGRSANLTGDHLVKLSRAELAASGPLAGLVRRYSRFEGLLAARGVACARLHGVGERCARWLLTTRDRAGADTFALTQDDLAGTLGVRRANVTAAGVLRQAGAIRYTRGRITVADRGRLAAAACGCYRAVRAEYDRLFPPGEGRG